MRHGAVGDSQGCHERNPIGVMAAWAAASTMRVRIAW